MDDDLEVFDWAKDKKPKEKAEPEKPEEDSCNLENGECLSCGS